MSMSSSSPNKASLPYNGNLQEAIKHRDREAVKQLMSLREFNSEEKECSTVSNESKFNFNELVDALIALGFSNRQIHDFIQSPHVEDDHVVSQEATAAVDFTDEALGLKALFDYSDRHFPIPRRKIKNVVTSESSLGPLSRNSSRRVTQQMLKGMDVDFTWTLMQTCIDNPEISQLDCYDVLQSVQVLVGGDILTAPATSFLRNSLIAGHMVEVKCVVDTLELLLAPDAELSSPGFSPMRRTHTRTGCSSNESLILSPLCAEKETTMSDNVNFQFEGTDDASMHALTEEDDDALLQSYICPITREILVEPITLQVLKY
jgi:hypothetical protein